MIKILYKLYKRKKIKKGLRKALNFYKKAKR
jgi:hypothetical protein